MASVNGEIDIDQLLRSKGLKCVCQLCDCGRPHKHPGCKLLLPTIAATFKEEKDSMMQSDYTARFQAYDLQPAKAVRHGDELQQTLPQIPMDLKTTKQTSYQKFDNPEMRKPCKLQGEIDKLLGGEFHDKTNYNDAFVGYTAKLTKSARPATVCKPNTGVGFSSESEYRKCFPKKEKVEQERFAEKPSHTYKILHPDHSKVPTNSLKNSVHDGRQCEKVRPCDMGKPNIDFGLHGEFDHTTTNGIHFKDYDMPVRTKYKRRSERKTDMGKFDAISQNKADFKYDEKEARIARGKRLTEPPSMIHLSMDMPHDFKTVANLSYHDWKPENFKRPIAENPDSKKYLPPTDKFDHRSHTYHDYVDYGARPRTEMIHPPEFQSSNAKVSEDTSYKAAFKNHGKPERKYYGEYHSSTLQMPPPESKFDASSTMRYDYIPMKIEKVRSYKPTFKVQTNLEKLSTATEYNERFLPKKSNLCKFSKYLTAQEAAKLAKSEVRGN